MFFCVISEMFQICIIQAVFVRYVHPSFTPLLPFIAHWFIHGWFACRGQTQIASICLLLVKIVPIFHPFRISVSFRAVESSLVIFPHSFCFLEESIFKYINCICSSKKGHIFKNTAHDKRGISVLLIEKAYSKHTVQRTLQSKWLVLF